MANTLTSWASCAYGSWAQWGSRQSTPVET